jgi:hypothetical protein
MKIAVFVLLLSMLANLSFANFSGDTLSVGAAYERMDTADRNGLAIGLLGDWVNLTETAAGNGLGSLSILSNGKFIGTIANGQRICGTWEISTDTLSLVLHKICETTGQTTGTIEAQLALVDGHILTLELPKDLGGKQTFIQ